MQALQDFNFELQYNLFTTGGATTTLTSMRKVGNYLRTFAATGMGASYINLYTTKRVLGNIQYLNQKFMWPRTAYMQRYNQAFAQQSSDCFYKLQFSANKIEQGFSLLNDYATAKSNGTDPGTINAT